jgi:glutamate dehydrogenase/leucine dehydrogenase
MGGAFVLKEIAAHFNLKPSETRVVIQGFGNAGMHMARILDEWGYSIIAVSDSGGGIYDPAGLDIPKIIRHKEETGSVKKFQKAKELTNQELLELECHVLVPAALENQITSTNAGKINAKYVVELANGPVSPEADEILFKRGIFVAPDVLSNAGGVIVSYFEWVQNLQGYYWTEEEVNKKLETIMVRAFHEVYDATKKYLTHMRNGAYFLALSRILQAEKLRGNL